MITSKKELRQYLYRDLKQFNYKKPSLKNYILRNEKWFIYRLKRELRYVEYYKNVKPFGGGILYLYHFLLYKHLCWKTKCIINPNTTGAGLTIWHLGSFTYIRKGSKVGDDFTIVCGTVLGKKTGKSEEHIEIGNNCYCGLNVSIIGNVRIGNNVTIGAHAVVTKNIPDNSVIGGVPAKIIKFKE
ncbi:MAG: serine acetyltransferase [Clostridia bacterium]|nr:serine acetyltransferase [Clostridia bacterium]